MLNVLLARLKQGHRTAAYPKQPPALPDRFRGLPLLDPAKCPAGCEVCKTACPTEAIVVRQPGAETSGAGLSSALEQTGTNRSALAIDLGRCLFCTDCVQACPEGAIAYSQEYRLAARSRQDLLWDGSTRKMAGALEEQARRLFGRSLKLRQVSAGGCNACESDVNVLNTVVFDLGRFGIQFVASPRHADGLLVTGPVSENMRFALKKTYEAVPPPKLVIAVGACAISGGPYVGYPEVHNGADSMLPVDLYIPGCPPHPWTILDGLLRLLGQIDHERLAP
jgi:Ni,Fe-hydrogenase III small subunit/NAD-dependent dihydropyrimidine dehydrogenase PreA subunit